MMVMNELMVVRVIIVVVVVVMKMEMVGQRGRIIPAAASVGRGS